MEFNSRGVKVVLTIDNCFSGGIIEEADAALNDVPHVIMTTCSQSGFGYDESTAQHGAWTNCLLVSTLWDSPLQIPLWEAFQRACALYTHRDNKDLPQFKGSNSLSFAG